MREIDDEDEKGTSILLNEVGKAIKVMIRKVT